MESGSLDDMYERLCELEDSPIDLNNATDDDLQQLTFLSEQQREGPYRLHFYYYRPLRSMGEIAMIESMDPLRIQLLRHFTFIGSNDTEKQVFSLEKALKYGKNELVATTRYLLRTQRRPKRLPRLQIQTLVPLQVQLHGSCKPVSRVRRMPANLSSATVTNSVTTIIPIIFLSENWGASRLWLSVNTN